MWSPNVAGKQERNLMHSDLTQKDGFFYITDSKQALQGRDPSGVD